MTILPFTKDWFSKIRGLNMTVDGAHLNSRLAKLIASEIEKTINNKFKEEDNYG